MINKQTSMGDTTDDGADRTTLNGSTHPTVAKLAEQSGAKLPGDDHPGEWKLTDKEIDAIINEELQWARQVPGRHALQTHRYTTEDEIWEHTKYGGGGHPFMGLDDGMLRAIAWLYRNRPGWTDEQIIRHVLERVRAIKGRDAPREHWDGHRERWKAEDKLRRY